MGEFVRMETSAKKLKVNCGSQSSCSTPVKSGRIRLGMYYGSTAEPPSVMIVAEQEQTIIIEHSAVEIALAILPP